MLFVTINIYTIVILGAGLIPVSKLHNKLYFLLGKDIAYNKWSDFGGKSERGESRLSTAAREGWEETNGFLGSQDKIKQNIIKSDLPIFKTHDNRHSCYLMNIKYNKELPMYMTNNYYFIKDNIPHIIDNNHNGLYEKDIIDWFTIEELKNFSEFRSYFIDIVWKIDKKYDEILEKYD
jgi:hypothetical protein